MTDMPTPTLDDLAGQVAQALDLTTQRVNALFAHSGSGRMPSDESKRNLTAGVLSALGTAARLAVTWCGATDHARRLHQQVINTMNKAPMTSEADFDARVYALLDVIREATERSSSPPPPPKVLH